MKNKEYLETTFPDGTPVKIYPKKEQQAIITNPTLKFLTWQQVKEQEAYFSKLEKEYWREETRKCLEDPKYYFAKYIKLINLTCYEN
jgi:hypothetical protein